MLLTLGAFLLNGVLSAQAAAAAPAPGPRRSPDFDVQKIGDGVYVLIRNYPPGLMVDGNSAFIVGDDDVIVVDAPESSREMLAAIRAVTSKPVRYLVNTHWHDDHITGDHVYRDAFPGIEIVGHPQLREYLPSTGETNRHSMLEGAPKVQAYVKKLLETNKSFTGTDLTPEERQSYESDIALVDHYLEVVPKTRYLLPTMTVEDRLTLHRGNRTVEIRDLGRGHTSGDLVVQLPGQGIVMTGDLVVWPVPLVGSEQSHVGDWGQTLERVLALRPSVIVPGHGPVLRDDSYPRLMTRLFASINDQVRGAVSRGETLEQARASVRLGDLKKSFAGDSRVRAFLFDTYVTDPAVASAYADARAAARAPAPSS